MLQGKTVVLGVTGGIAAYKAAALASALIKLHACVEVVMTQNATQFIAPLTFEQLTGNKTLVNTFDRNFVHQVEHISLAEEADLVLLVPATANIIGKLASGIADSVVSFACKAHLRNGRPIVLSISTNDGLAAAAKNIGELLNRKNFYFVPFGQDDPAGKPCSLMADFSRIGDTIERALVGQQLQPVLVT